MLVCGGRDYVDGAAVFRALDRAHAKRPITLLIHGAARGADTLAEKWARDRQIPYVGVPAEWTRLRKAAGPIRNQRMLDEWKPEGVIAFPGNDGTSDMKERADKAGIKIWEPYP